MSEPFNLTGFEKGFAQGAKEALSKLREAFAQDWDREYCRDMVDWLDCLDKNVDWVKDQLEV